MHLTSAEHSIGAFPMKPSETATRASAGHDKNQLMVHPFTSPGNLRARSGNLPFVREKGKIYSRRCKRHKLGAVRSLTVQRSLVAQSAQQHFSTAE